MLSGYWSEMLSVAFDEHFIVVFAIKIVVAQAGHIVAQFVVLTVDIVEWAALLSIDRSDSNKEVKTNIV